MTPNDIDVLMHCYTTPGKHDRFDTPAVKESIEMLLHLGAIRPCTEYTDAYRVTEMGKKWAISICNVPPPINKREIQITT